MSRKTWWWAAFIVGALLVPGVPWSSDSQSVPGEGEANDDLLSTLSSLVPLDQHISVDFQDASIHTILRSFSECSGLNIVASPDIEGRASVTLKDVPWATGLGMILKANGLSAVEERGVLRVGSAQGLANEELSLRSAERRREELLPLTTKMIRVVYAKAEELKRPLERLLSARGTVEVETRTNSLLVVDIESVVERISDMVAELDTSSRQVEITTKLVDADASVIQELGIDWQATGMTSDGFDGDITASVDASLSQPAGFLRIGTTAADGNLDVLIDALARENRARIISNPRITTLNNQEARILVGKKIPLVVTDEAGNAITQLTTIGIKMEVTPHINSEGYITLELHPEVSDLSAQATVQGGIIIVTSEALTRVVVRDGETAVIGGLIRENETTYKTGVPVLMDIPLLGHLFSSNNTTTEQRELVIFVTPRIIAQG